MQARKGTLCFPSLTKYHYDIILLLVFYISSTNTALWANRRGPEHFWPISTFQAPANHRSQHRGWGKATCRPGLASPPSQHEQLIVNLARLCETKSQISTQHRFYAGNTMTADNDVCSCLFQPCLHITSSLFHKHNLIRAWRISRLLEYLVGVFVKPCFFFFYCTGRLLQYAFTYACVCTHILTGNSSHVITARGETADNRVKKNGVQAASWKKGERKTEKEYLPHVG